MAWTAEPNGAGGWQVVNRDSTGFITETISDKSHYAHADRAADRLNFDPAQWREFYSVKPYSPAAD